MKTLIRTDAGVTIGNGHIIRMMALASEFADRKVDLSFALKQDAFWVNRLSQRGYSVVQLKSAEIEELIALIRVKNVTHFIYDTRNDLTRQQVERIKLEAKVKVIVIDSPEDVRLAADVAIFPPIPQVKEWSWEGYGGKIYSGWEYVLLRNEFSVQNPRKSLDRKVLLSFGSTDPFYLSEWTLNEIERTVQVFQNYEIILLVGPQFERIEKLKQLPVFQKLKITMLQSPNNLVEVFLSVDFAIIALGVTAYELASLAVPFLFISISADHAKSGGVFESDGLGSSLGILGEDLDHFDVKVKRFVETLDIIKNNLETFRSRNKICDWSKIINVIIHA